LQISPTALIPCSSFPVRPYRTSTCKFIFSICVRIFATSTDHAFVYANSSISNFTFFEWISSSLNFDVSIPNASLSEVEALFSVCGTSSSALSTSNLRNSFVTLSISVHSFISIYCMSFFNVDNCPISFNCCICVPIPAVSATSTVSNCNAFSCEPNRSNLPWSVSSFYLFFDSVFSMNVRVHTCDSSII